MRLNDELELNAVEGHWLRADNDRSDAATPPS